MRRLSLEQESDFRFLCKAEPRDKGGAFNKDCLPNGTFDVRDSAWLYCGVHSINIASLTGRRTIQPSNNRSVLGSMNGLRAQSSVASWENF